MSKVPSWVGHLMVLGVAGACWGRGGLGEGSGGKEQEGGEVAEAHGARSEVFGRF